MARGGGGAQGKIENTCCQYDKVGCVFTMVILSEFRMGQYRDDDYRKDALHFTILIEVHYLNLNRIRHSHVSTP